MDDFSFVSLWFTSIGFTEMEEVDVSNIVVVVVGVVVGIIVFLIVVMNSADIGPSSSMMFSEEPVPFIGSCRQHRILVVGHCTSSRTSSHINVANACTHTPGQSAIFAVLVKEFKNPDKKVLAKESSSCPAIDPMSTTKRMMPLEAVLSIIFNLSLVGFTSISSIGRVMKKEKKRKKGKKREGERLFPRH